MECWGLLTNALLFNQYTMSVVDVVQEYESGRHRRLAKLSFVGHSLGQPPTSPVSNQIASNPYWPLAQQR